MKSITRHLIETAQLTLQYHDQLNPKLWDGTELKSEVRKKLLMIAHTWAAFAKIPTDAIKDIIMVGGNANFNYTDSSDIDVHLVVKSDQLMRCTALLDEYFKNKKELWELVHKIKIYGHDVELYAQDVSTKYTKDQGVFSLKNNEWLVVPKQKQINLDDPILQKKVDHYAEKINTLINTNASEKILHKLKHKLKNMRATSIQKGGEFSMENLVFKELRNRGYMKKIEDYIHSNQDKNLSL